MDPETAWFVGAALVAFGAGLVKGAVGFAMPMLMISGLGAIVEPELALAGLMLPTVASNLLQALDGGLRGAWSVVRTHRLYIGLVVLGILGVAQMVPFLPDRAMKAAIGALVTGFAALDLAGFRRALPAGGGRGAEILLALLAGLSGGLSGVWGPPTVAWLLARGVGRVEMIRVQGVVYLLGSFALVAGHIGSGVLDGPALGFSAALTVPAMLGVVLGRRLLHRLDEARFRRLALIVLLLAGLNLLRGAVA